MPNDSSFTEQTELEVDAAALLEKLPLISRTLISLGVPTGGERLKLHLMNWLVVSGLVHSPPLSLSLFLPISLRGCVRWVWTLMCCRETTKPSH